MSGIALDVRTLIFVLTMARLVEAAVFLYAWRVQRQYLPMRYWALGATSASAGMFLVGMRDIVPLFWSVLLGNALLLFGTLEFNAGIVTSCDRKPPLRIGFAILVAVLVSFAWFTFVTPDTALRILIYALATAMFSGYAIFVLLKSASAPLASTRMLIAGVLGVESALSLFRGFDSYFHHVAGVLQSTPFQLIWFMILIAQVIVLTFACTLLTSQRLQIELEHVAKHDPLTELWNRRAFFDLVAREWAHSARNNDTFAALMIDVDKFKSLNDRFGHAAGDEVLKAVALTLNRELRPRDVLGRYGGEEFAVILPGADLAQAEVIGERLRAAIAALHLDVLGGAEVTVSVGVARGNAPAASIDAVLAEADRAMYAAKGAGRNRVVVV